MGSTFDCTRNGARVRNWHRSRHLKANNSSLDGERSKVKRLHLISRSLFVLKFGACRWLGRSPSLPRPGDGGRSWPSLNDCRVLDDVLFISDTKRDTNATCSIHLQIKSLKSIAFLANEYRHHNPCVGGSSPSSATKARFAHRPQIESPLGGFSPLPPLYVMSFTSSSLDTNSGGADILARNYG